MNDFFDANYRITDLRTEKGKIVDLGINNKHIDLSNYDENKTVTITENGIIEIIPSEDKNGMRKVTVTTNVQPNLDENKTVTISENGRIEVIPSKDKKGMKKVTVTTNVQPNLDENKEHTIDASLYDSSIEINPSYEKDGMKKVTVSLKNVHNNLYAWKHSTDLIYSLEVPTSNKTLDIFVSENKSEIIGHTLYIHKYTDLEKDVGDYLLDKIRYKEQDYIRSSEDDIRI